MAPKNLLLRMACVLGSCILLGACSLEDRSERILVAVEGSVTTSSDDSPVQGATVILGTGGYLLNGTILDFATTGPDGRYRIEHEVAYYPESPGGCQVWLSASANGYEMVPGDGNDGVYTIPCTEERQTVNLVLRRTET